MKSPLKLLFLFLSLTFASGCTLYTIDSYEKASQFYPSKASTNDVAYEEVVTRQHEIVGTVTVNAERHQDLSKVVEQIKFEAAILGGDAITNIRSNSGTGKWAKVKPQKLFGNANVRTNYIADVVVYKE